MQIGHVYDKKGILTLSHDRVMSCVHLVILIS